MLNSVNNSDSVKEVVLTSSVAAMYSDASECLQYENNEITESVLEQYSLFRLPTLFLF